MSNVDPNGNSGSSQNRSFLDQRHSLLHKAGKLVGRHEKWREQVASKAIKDISTFFSLIDPAQTLGKSEKGAIRNHIYTLKSTKGKTREIKETSQGLGKELAHKNLKKTVSNLVYSKLKTSKELQNALGRTFYRYRMLQSVARILGVKTQPEILIENLTNKIEGLLGDKADATDVPPESINGLLGMSIESLLSDNTEDVSDVDAFDDNGSVSSGGSDANDANDANDATSTSLVDAVWGNGGGPKASENIREYLKSFIARKAIDTKINEAIESVSGDTGAISSSQYIEALRGRDKKSAKKVAQSAAENIAEKLTEGVFSRGALLKLAKFAEKAEKAAFHQGTFSEDEIGILYSAITGTEYNETSVENNDSGSAATFRGEKGQLSKKDADSLFETLQRELQEGKALAGDQRVRGFGRFMNELSTSLEEQLRDKLLHQNSGFISHFQYCFRTDPDEEHTKIDHFLKPSHDHQGDGKSKRIEKLEEVLVKYFYENEDADEDLSRVAKRLYGDHNFRGYSIRGNQSGESSQGRRARFGRSGGFDEDFGGVGAPRSGSIYVPGLVDEDLQYNDGVSGAGPIDATAIDANIAEPLIIEEIESSIIENEKNEREALQSALNEAESALEDRSILEDDAIKGIDQEILNSTIEKDNSLTFLHSAIGALGEADPDHSLVKELADLNGFTIENADQAIQTLKNGSTSGTEKERKARGVLFKALAAYKMLATQLSLFEEERVLNIQLVTDKRQNNKAQAETALDNFIKKKPSYTQAKLKEGEKITDHINELLDNPSSQKGKPPLRLSNAQLYALLKYEKPAKPVESSFYNLFGMLSSSNTASSSKDRVLVDLTPNFDEEREEMGQQLARDFARLILNRDTTDEFSSEEYTLSTSLQDALKDHPNLSFRDDDDEIESFADRICKALYQET